LGSIRNVLNRNIAIPIGYGRLRIGSAVISNDIIVQPFKSSEVPNQFLPIN
jgi:predicted phage tail protein